MFAGVILLTLIAITASARKNYKTSDERLYALGKTDDAEFEFTAMDNLRFEKSKLILSEHFAYSGSTVILWRMRISFGSTSAFSATTASLFPRSSSRAHQRTFRGAGQPLCDDELIEQAVTKILSQNPNVLVGYSFDYARQYRAKVKEFKQTSR